MVPKLFVNFPIVTSLREVTQVYSPFIGLSLSYNFFIHLLHSHLYFLFQSEFLPEFFQNWNFFLFFVLSLYWVYFLVEVHSDFSHVIGGNQKLCLSFVNASGSVHIAGKITVYIDQIKDKFEGDCYFLGLYDFTNIFDEPGIVLIPPNLILELFFN